MNSKKGMETNKYKNNSGYHQNVQSKYEHDVNSQQNQYDGKKKKNQYNKDTNESRA